MAQRQRVSLMGAAPPERYDVEATLARTLDRKMQRRGNVQHDPATLDDVHARLQTFLTERIAGTFVLGSLERLTGGASKEQFVFDLAWTERGEQRRDRMVLRMNPPASVVETSRLREFEMLRAVRGTVPVPEVFWVTEDDAAFGEPALICGFVPGTASPAGAAKTASGLGTTYGSRLRPILGEQFVRYLAELHRWDWRGADLPSFERPEAGGTEAVDRRIALWDRVWDEDAFEPHPTIMLTRQWLWQHRPVVDTVSVVHGDYRNGNFLFDEGSGQITAVLDWELSYLGDRHSDLAYAMLDSWGEHDETSGEFYCSALATRTQFIETYERISGLPVDPVRLKYYTVLNSYWAAVAMIATGPRISVERMTHLDVMLNFLSGLGAHFADKLNALVIEDGG